MAATKSLAVQTCGPEFALVALRWQPDCGSAHRDPSTDKAETGRYQGPSSLTVLAITGPSERLSH